MSDTSEVPDWATELEERIERIKTRIIGRLNEVEGRVDTFDNIL